MILIRKLPSIPVVEAAKCLLGLAWINANGDNA